MGGPAHADTDGRNLGASGGWRRLTRPAVLETITANDGYSGVTGGAPIMLDTIRVKTKDEQTAISLVHYHLARFHPGSGPRAR